MPVVVVVCSGCGAKLKAPEAMAGRKAKCKRCGNSFRVPGTLPSDSVGDGQPLSSFSTPSPFSNEDVLMAEPVDEVPMATAVIPSPPPTPPIPPPAPIPVSVPAPTPAKDLSSLPSADPFDFGKQAKPATPTAKPTPTPSAKPATAKPTASTTPTGPATAKSAPSPIPATPATAKPATPPTPAAAAPLNLSPPTAKAKATPPEPSDPFAFTDSPAKSEKASKSKRRKDEDEDDDEDEPIDKKKKRAEEENEEPVSKKKRSEDEEGEPKAKKKRRDDDEEDKDAEDKQSTKMKAKSASKEESDPSNPFSDLGVPEQKSEKKSKRRDEEDDEDEPKSKKKHRDDEEDDEPKSKKKRRDGEEDKDVEDKQSTKTKTKSASKEESDSPNPFSDLGVPEQKSEKKPKRRDDEEDNDEPRSKKKRRDEEDDEPKSKKKRDEEEDKDVEDKQPTKTKAKSASKEERDPYLDFGPPEEMPEKKSKRRDDEEVEPKAKKKHRDEEDDKDAEDKQSLKAKAKSASKEASEPRNTFSDLGASEEKSEKKSKRRDDEEDEDEPKSKKKHRDGEDELKSKKKRGDEDDKDVEDKQPIKTKAKPASKEASDSPNPLSNFGASEEKPEKKSKRRDDEENEDEPKAKKKRRDDEEEDKNAEDEQPTKTKAKPAQKQTSETYNPFSSFGAPEEKSEKKSNRRDEEEGESKSKKKSSRDEEGNEEEQKPRYHRPEEKGGMGMTVLITAVVGLFALGLGITALVMFVKNNRKEQLVKKDEKKDEASIPSASNESDPKSKDKDPDPKSRDFKPKPKDKGPDPKPKDKDPDPNPGPGPVRPALTLAAKLKTINVEGAPPKAQPADKPQAGMVLDTPFKTVKRFFPPFDPKTADTYVLIQTSAGAGGKGEKLALDAYSPTGARVATSRIEYEGDGQPNPIVDLAASATGNYFLAATEGKLHVWSVNTKNKIADGINPYAEKPEHAKGGLAAAFFAADPNQVVLVSTAGAVLLYDLRTNKPVSEFIPPNGVTGKVSLGKSVAKADGGGSVGIAVAGVLYQVKSAPGLEVVRQFDLGGDVKNSLGLALSGTPGRILYTFDTIEEKPGQSTMGILDLPLGENAKPIIYRGSGIGAVSGALWAGEGTGGVVAGGGVLWFNDDEGKFSPMVMARPTTSALYVGDSRYFWYLIPHPKEMTKSAMVGLSVPFAGFPEYQKRFEGGQALQSVIIDGNGLAK